MSRLSLTAVIRPAHTKLTLEQQRRLEALAAARRLNPLQPQKTPSSATGDTPGGGVTGTERHLSVPTRSMPVSAIAGCQSTASELRRLSAVVSPAL
jgi:hypothetical protein